MIRGRRRICISSPEVDRAPNRQSSAFPVLVAGRTTLEIPPRGPHKQKTFDGPAHLEYGGLRPREERGESGEERFRGDAKFGVRRFPTFSHAVGGGAGCAGPGSLTGRWSPHQRRKISRKNCFLFTSPNASDQRGLDGQVFQRVPRRDILFVHECSLLHSL
jgi:hypothetical protein